MPCVQDKDIFMNNTKPLVKKKASCQTENGALLYEIFKVCKPILVAWVADITN